MPSKHDVSLPGGGGGDTTASDVSQPAAEGYVSGPRKRVLPTETPVNNGTSANVPDNGHINNNDDTPQTTLQNGDSIDEHTSLPQRPGQSVSTPQRKPMKKRFSESSLRIYTNPGLPDRSDENIREEGRELFENFIREEIQRAGLEEPECMTPQVSSYSAERNAYAASFTCQPSTSSQPDVSQNTLAFPTQQSRKPSSPMSFKNPIWANTGRELREMADEFGKTKEREVVRGKADNIALSSVNYIQFAEMLSELFVDGNFTRQRVVVLFCFCSDVAIRALKQKAIDYFMKFLQWSLQYITEKVCAWVEAHGGWEAVIRHTARPIMIATICLSLGLAVGLVAMYYMMRGKGSK